MTNSNAIAHVLREARFEDVPSIREIFNHAIIHTTAVYSYEPYSVEEIEDWFNKKLSQKFPVYVSTLNDKVTGFVTYGKFRERPAYKYCAEHSIYVHHDYRRQGIARLLMDKIIDVAQLNELHSLIGGIDASNQISIDFHSEFGFEKAGLIKEVGYKFNKWLDLQFMQLIFETPRNPKEG